MNSLSTGQAVGLHVKLGPLPMVPPTPTPSPRLVQAAEAERQQLVRHRQELLEARKGVRAELARLEASLDLVTEREALLDRLVGIPAGMDAEEKEGSARPTAYEDVPNADEGLTVLRGPDIRCEAVRVLVTRPERPEALHYRDWYALLRAAGFAAGGKDPLATFLTQLSRSPAVRKSTQTGVYELDRDALRRLRRQRDEVREELRALTAKHTKADGGATTRARRTVLNSELGRVEKALEEVEMLFEDTDVPALAA